MGQYDDVWKNDSVDAHFKADIPQKMLELFEKENVQTILDLGSGDGTIAVDLAKQGRTVYALEISNDGIEKTKARAQEAHVSVLILEQDMYQFTNPLEMQLEEFKSELITYGCFSGGILLLYKAICANGGRCYGMAASAGSYFIYPNLKPLSGYPWNWSETTPVMSNINAYHINQLIYKLWLSYKDPNDIYNSIK